MMRERQTETIGKDPQLTENIIYAHTHTHKTRVSLNVVWQKVVVVRGVRCIIYFTRWHLRVTCAKYDSLFMVMISKKRK